MQWTLRKTLHAVVLAMALCAGASAEPVRGIVAASIDPILVRGGVMMLPLAAQQHGTDWPSNLILTGDRGETIEGVIGWLEPIRPKLERNWTDDPRNIHLRAMTPNDDSSNPALGAPILLARLPMAGSGQLRLDKQLLQPLWVDAPTEIEIVDPELRTLSVRSQRDMPDAASTLEHWRWVLLADSMRMSAPPADRFDQLNAMLAEHQAALWRIAIERLRQADNRLADRCVQLLTATAVDREQRFAAWVAEPAALDALLRVLLQFDRDDSTIVREAEAWLAQQSPLLVWPMSMYSGVVELALVNRSDRAVTAELIWENANQPAQSLRVPQGVLSKLQIKRPEPPSRGIGVPALDTAEPQILHVYVGGGIAGSLTFPTEETIAKPPGVFIAALFPVMTLADVERSRQAPAPLQFGTSLHVRRLGGKWELFLDCRRPEQTVTSRVTAIQNATMMEDVRGIEAVTLLIGKDTLSSEPAAVLTVPELGWWKLLRGRQEGALQIHRQSYPDRWYCRAVLPASWLETVAADNVLLLGLVRTHDNSDAIETAPNRTVPWRIEPGQLRINLSEWDDLPRFQE